jgi:hypothetical protein
MCAAASSASPARASEYHELLRANISSARNTVQLPVEKTFEDFIIQYGGELVSKLISNNNPPKNADYLFRNPPVVAELKVVERDGFTAEDKAKLDKLAHGWMQRRLIGPIFGTRQIEIRKLPPPCQQEWLNLHMAPWKRKLADANKQIKSMKSVLQLPDACGILFIVDDAAHSFAPEDVMGFISRVLRSTKQDGSQIYSHLDRIVYFSVNPRAITKDGAGLNFWLPAYRNANDRSISEFLDSLGRAWFEYHASLFGVKPVQMSLMDQPFKGTWTEGLRGLRVRG